MERNAFKTSILAWLAFLLFVFSCESKEEKERARVERDRKSLLNEREVLENSIANAHISFEKAVDSLRMIPAEPERRDCLFGERYTIKGDHRSPEREECKTSFGRSVEKAAGIRDSLLRFASNRIREIDEHLRSLPEK